MRTTILIAMDHPLLRVGLQTVIERDTEYLVIGHAADLRTMIEKCMTLMPELLVLDLALPGGHGIDAIQQLKRRRPQQKILALGDCRSELEAGDAMRAGCGGYLLKRSSQEEALRALRAVKAGRRYVCDDLADQLLGEALRIDPPTRDGSLWDNLSARERSVFRLIAGGNTNRTAARELNLSPKTIEKHRANLMRKLNARNALELMWMAVDLGLVERPVVAARTAPNGRMQVAVGLSC